MAFATLKPKDQDQDLPLISQPAPFANPITGPTRQWDASTSVPAPQPKPLPLATKESTASASAAPFTPEYFQQKQAELDYKKAHPWGSPENHPGLGGKIMHDISSGLQIAGDIAAPRAMEMIPGSKLNMAGRGLQNEEGFDKATLAELNQAKAKRAGMEPLDKIVGHYVNAQGQEVWKRESGAEEATGEVQQKPDLQVIPNVAGEGGAPSTEVFKKSDLAGGNAKPVVTLAETAKPVAPKPTYKPIGVGGDNEQMAVFSDPKDPTKYSLVGQPYKRGTMVPLLTAEGDLRGMMDNKTGHVTPISPEQAATGEGAPLSTASGQRLKNTESNQFNTQYVNPATNIERSWQMFQQAAAQYNSDPKTGAASMMILAQHLGTTFGQLKGARQTRDIIMEHKDAIGIMDRIERFGMMLESGQQLAPDQVKEFGDLINGFRQFTWQMTAHEGTRRDPTGASLANLLPAEARINMINPKGQKGPVLGGKVADAVKAGYKVDF